MTFGEKLFKLRKENGLSQEALAEKLNTTRQAISKWENGQGYPETEKLLMIGNIFGVSMDYLLKDTVKLSNNIEEGYYVSKEMAEGYLLAARKASKYIALGFFFIALAFLPYFTFKDEPGTYLIPTIILATIGIGMFVTGSFFEDEQYKVLKQEPLLFDETYLKTLNGSYDRLKKKYAVFIIIGSCSFVAGMLPFLLERKVKTFNVLESYYPFCIACIAVGIYMLVHTSAILEAYKLLANNKAYTNRLSFKLRRKMRQKVDEF